MRIAVFASAFYPHIGGVEELVRELALAYRAKGHDPMIVTNRWPRDLPDREVIDGIEVHRPALRWPVGSFKAKATYAASHGAVLRQVVGILEDHRTEVVHVQCVSSNGLYAREAADRLGLPLVVTTQGELTMDAGQIFERHEYVRDQYLRLAEAADAFTACSAKTLRDAEAYVGHPLPDAQVIHNGANTEVFGRADPWPSERPYAFAIGRLVPQKGFDLLLRAYRDADPAADLLLAGEGPDREALGQLAAELGIADRVTFFGPADRDQVPRLHRGASFVVLPSRTDEGLPLVSIEAMAAGRALIATETGGIREAVTDGEDAVLVPKGDVEALTAALKAVDADPALRDRLGAAALTRAATFSWSSLADRYLAVFAGVAGGPSSPDDLSGPGRAR